MLMGCFCIMHWVIIHLRCEVLPHQFCSSLLNQSKDYSSVTVTIHPDTSIMSWTQQWHRFTGSHTWPLPRPCLTDSAICFRSGGWDNCFNDNNNNNNINSASMGKLDHLDSAIAINFHHCEFLTPTSISTILLHTSLFPMLRCRLNLILCIQRAFFRAVQIFKNLQMFSGKVKPCLLYVECNQFAARCKPSRFTFMNAEEVAFLCNLHSYPLVFSMH